VELEEVRVGADSGRGTGSMTRHPWKRGLMAVAWTGACRWRPMGRGGSWHSRGARGGASWTKWRSEVSGDDEVLSRSIQRCSAA
jgi:hypothetical protein